MAADLATNSNRRDQFTIVRRFGKIMTPIDWNKPVQTKDGRKFFYLGRIPHVRLPIVGYIEGDDVPGQWPADGRINHNFDSNNDLINVPEKHKLWVNVYRDDNGDWRSGIEASKEAADLRDGYNIYTRIACIRIEFHEGEGLS